MPIFLDTGFYFALIDKKDTHHKKAQTLLKKIITGKFGSIYTSEYVLDESLTLINGRTYGKRIDLVDKMYHLFMGDGSIAQLISIQEIWIPEIYSLQKKITRPGDPLSFTDASNIVICQHLQISKIIAFDEHFRGILEIVE